MAPNINSKMLSKSEKFWANINFNFFKITKLQDTIQKAYSKGETILNACKSTLRSYINDEKYKQTPKSIYRNSLNDKIMAI